MVSSPALDKRREAIQAMFATAAPRYDLLNHLLSGNLDRIWRRRAVASLALPTESRILDLATGTGDLAFALGNGGFRAVGADFCFEMLAIGRRKARRRTRLPLPLLAADALHLPFRSGSFDGLTIGFGVRNFEDLPRGLAEMSRVLRPGGRLAILEFPPPPKGPFGILLRFYLTRVLPTIGSLLSPNGAAYSYLPASVEGFASPEELAKRMAEAGLADVRYELLTFGTAALHLATKR
jgi:demethylmenaquinone methyltransferase/2-methoxy-6-polyprenyl-1,4-benzoquinol methylase